MVDGSAVVRKELQLILEKEPDMEVIGAVPDPVYALDNLSKEWPDVIVLDVEMPRMDSVTFVKKIMAERPTPVVLFFTLTENGLETALQALDAGVAEIVTKPMTGLKKFLHESSSEWVNVVRALAKANVKSRGETAALQQLTAKPRSAVILRATGSRARVQATQRIVAIGTSAGGTKALEVVLNALPENCPGIVVVQHMPEKFTFLFAERLNSLCRIEVREAKNNDRVLPGLALIAPGGYQMLLKRRGAFYHVEVIDAPPVSRHRPSVDVLFSSVAQHAGKNAIGIIMTGMGDDGARGLKEMLDAGADTVAQDEASCVVFGMPKEAIKLGAAKRIMPLNEIHLAILGK